MIVDIETAKTKWCPMCTKNRDLKAELCHSRCLADVCMHWTYITGTEKGFCGQAPPLITKENETITIKDFE